MAESGRHEYTTGIIISTYDEITLPPAALPGAKLLKKFDQNFLLVRIKSAHTLPPAAKRLIAPPREWG
ncbi:MAG: hypothetical protein KAW12_06205 [Candidatus Aminicenantes bacterium]|nr:hypothetical protein [Candidatus Aminicenantes bacterium]